MVRIRHDDNSLLVAVDKLDSGRGYTLPRHSTAQSLQASRMERIPIVSKFHLKKRVVDKLGKKIPPTAVANHMTLLHV